MRRVELPDEDMTHFGSEQVRHRPLARVIEPLDGFAVDVLTVAPGGRVGRHPTRLWQLFAVVSGDGWVAAADGRRIPVRAGEAVVWSPGRNTSRGRTAAWSCASSRAAPTRRRTTC